MRAAPRRDRWMRIGISILIVEQVPGEHGHRLGA
jgi:hypothetical protein